MTIFALDSSSLSAGAAIVRDGILLAETFCNIGLKHSETLLPIADEVFRRAALEPKDIDYFATTSGPGSFTGLRIGMGIIKGMAMATGKPCVAIPTLEALAAQCSLYDGLVVPVMDARRSRFYCGAFRFDHGSLTELFTDRVLELPDLLLLLPEEPIVFVGDAAIQCADLSGRGKAVPGQLQYQKAGALALLAERYVKAGRTITVKQLAPKYVQLPGAERQRLLDSENGGESC